MNKNHSFFSAIKHAFRGLRYFFSYERNGKIQAGIAVIVIITAILLKVSTLEWLILLLCIGAVLSLEAINSALEKLCDLIQPGFHPVIKIIKDISAAAVLISSVISAIVGTIIFLPKLLFFLGL